MEYKGKPHKIFKMVKDLTPQKIIQETNKHTIHTFTNNKRNTN